MTASSAPAGGTSDVGAPSAAPGSSGTVTAPATTTESPTDAAVHLEALLGEHSVLALDLMRARIRSDADLAQAADAALGRNTSALGRLLQPVIGVQAEERFATLWARHLHALFDYSRGLATQDAALRDRSRADLVRDENGIADVVVSRSHGRIAPTAARDAVRMHVDHLLQAADAYAAKDYPTAARLYRESYEHTYDLGMMFARGLLPPDAVPALDSPVVQLQSALTRLLGEHVALVIAQMRSSVGDPADFTAMGSVVNANTLDLTSAIDSLFGAGAAKGFQDLWANHVDALMAYARAAADGDAAGENQARADLRAFETAFATYLDQATQGRLGRPALAQAVVMHDQMLLAVIDAYRAGDYVKSHDLGEQTYATMFTLSGQLARAIGETIARRLPRGGSQTGGGGMAHVVEGR
jgi:hypothetical protein